MSNDQNKAGINPISNKQLGTAPVPLIMPPTRRSTNAVAGKSAKSAKAAQQHDQQQQLPAEDQPLYDMAIVPEEGAAERALASAEAAMSVRRGEDDEEEATLEKSSHAEGDTAPILLAQASSTSKAADAPGSPASVGEELLRQAAPLPSTPPKASPDGSESWLGKDWKLPVAIGGGALALLGLAAGGGGSSANGSGISATPSATPPSSGNDGAPPPPSNTWNLTVTPAAGPFLAGASVHASAQKWVGGAWQEIASTTKVDRNGRMSFKIDKSMVTAQDILRVVVSDTGDSADHRDEIIGNQTLGATPLIAVIGGLDADQQVTANPLTTLAARQIGQNLSPDNMNAIHAAVAKAFGISVGDLVHVLPVFLGGGGNPVETDDGKNYGLALGVVAGMTQAQRAAGVPSNDALDKALKVLEGAFVIGADGKLVLDLQKIRSVEVVKGDGTKAQVGLDEGAARLYQATGDAEAGANGTQVPYISIDPREVSAAVQQAKGADVNISYASFTDGLTLKINTAASAKVGDNLHVEFVRLNADGKPIADAKPFTYDYVLTENDVKAINQSNPNDKGGKFFLLTIPTHLDDAAKYNLENGARPAIPSSTDSSNFLLPAEKGANSESSFYKPNSGSAQFQLRATGSALGFASAGARIALFSDQIAIEAAPATSDGITFNGAGAEKTSTIKVVMTLPYKISWSEGAAPTLDVMVGSKLLKASYTGGTGDVLHFALTFSSAANSESKELNNAVIRIPDNALHIGNNNGNKVSIYTDTGNTLFKSGDGGKNWTKRDNTPLSDGANLAKILGVNTTQLDTPYYADTTPPADPILELVAPPIFNADGFRDADQVPKAGEVNARAFIQGSSANVAYALVTNRITQEFKVKFEPGKFIAGDAGAIVRLSAYKVTDPSSINTLMAETKLGDTGEATFKASDYKVTSQSFRTLVNGLSTQAEGVELKFYVEVVDAAGNVSKKGELKSLGTLPGSGNSIWIDTVAPDAPTDLKLDSTSDTGRNGVAADSASRNDGITSISKPTLVLKGGTAGALAQIWSDATHTQLLGQGVVQVVAGQVTSNGASIVLDKAAINSGVNTVYATITDQAGNVSRTDKSFSFTYLPAFNGELLLDITSAQPTRGFYRKGDVIEVTVQFDRDVFLKNAQSNAQSTSQLRVILDSDNNKSINATYFIGLGTKTLKFRYTVEQDIERGSAGIFKATSLVSSGSSVLEDIAGNSIVIDPSKVKAVNGQEIKIDTVNPSVPILELPADIVATENTFSRANALGKGINLTAEDGSTVTLTFTKAGSNEVAVTKSVLVTGAGAQAVTLSVDELNKLGQGEISVKAQAVDPAGNMSVVSTGLTFKLDTQAPKATAKVVSPQGVGLTNGTVVFEVSFDEPLKRALTETDDNFFDVKNGTISKLQRIDDTRYRISVIPTPKVVSSDVTLELKSGMASPLSDKAGNLVETGVTLTRQAIDTQGPTVTATPDVQGPVMGGRDVSFTVVLSEPISVDYGVIGKGNFTATNGIVTSVTPIEGFGGLRYKVTVKPNALAVDGDIVLGLIATPSGNGALLRDALGNQTDNVPTLATQKIDVSPPKVVADDVSVTPILFDTHAPTLDADATLVDLQTTSRKLLTAAKAVAGEGLFAQDIAVWPTNDISSIGIKLDGPQLDLIKDKLVLDAPLSLNASLATVSGKSIGGVGGLSYGYDGSTHALTISKSSGAAMSGLDARAILKAIQYQNATPTAGDRSATITLTDVAGNSSNTGANWSVDMTVPGSITGTLVSNKQISYKTLTLPEEMGGTNKHNLHTGESVDLTSLLPAGMTPTSFLSSLKGLYTEWGGLTITGDANTTFDRYTTVFSFPSGFGLATPFSLVHQGGGAVKGENFTFTSADGKQLLLNAVNGFYVLNTDVYAFKTGNMVQNYDIGNVRLLYQVTTDNPNSLPTINVSYDGTKASAGDVIGLYEGDKLLGSRTSKFSDPAGNVVVGNDIRLTLASGAVAPVLSNLRVNGETPDTQPINGSSTKYAMIAETPLSPVTLVGLDQNLTFSGNVGGAGSGDSYLISVSMGGKVILFSEVKAGDFSLTTPANILAPGMYHDLTITATNTSAGINNGQTTILQNQTLGWYWVPQKLDSLSGGAGDDQIQLAVTTGGASTVVQTGQGKDTLTLGGFGTTDSTKLVATVSDFTLGQDKVKVFRQTVTKDNLDAFVTATPYSTNSTKLVVDLDGVAGGTVYTLYLQNLAYNPGNTHTIFGV
ncbi:hypothetical protein [Herbaspirillum rubrisubalbicans]|uniref:hypothetical protein n=1 Tax=Herbaspirillum rubrisubalbicans TaxID=80842 RepID=UPI0015ECB1A3|nr:hypothetical protein [Herbaspirillum rubrisubalbicans]